MYTSIALDSKRCDLCDGNPACVPACPQQLLQIVGDHANLSHDDRCPDGCSVCVDACASTVFSLADRIHEDLGRVPIERIDGPALIHHVAYLRAPDGETSPLRARFMALCDLLGIPVNQRSSGDRRCHVWGDLPGVSGGHLQMTWEVHTEYWSVRAVATGGPHSVDFDHRLESVIPALHDCGTPPVVTCLDLLVVDQEFDQDDVCSRITCRNRHGARVLGGGLSVFTNYEPVAGRERYIISGSPAAVAESATFAVTNIAQVENYYHLLLMPRLEERETIQVVHRMERALVTRMTEVTGALAEATPDQMASWLNDLTLDLSRVVQMSGRFNHVLSATFPYGERVRDGFSAWREQPVPGFSTLSEPILQRTRTVGDEYRAFLARLDRMEGEISDLVAILRTRVDMSMEAQNTQLLKNLDARSAIQLRLQELAEGLSVIVIAYYATGLAGYIFKALEKKHLIGSATVYTAVFIPIAAGVAWWVAHRGVTRIKREATARDVAQRDP